MKDLYLAHHGVKGMKWGVRKQYESTGRPMSKWAKRRAHRLYSREANKAFNDVARLETSRFVRAYNRAADDLNNGLTDKYNADWIKAHGRNYDDPEYEAGYERLFDNLYTKYSNQEAYKDFTSSKHYQKAMQYVRKYSMESYDDLVRENNEAIEYMRKAFDD